VENYTIDQIKAICKVSSRRVGIPFIDARLAEYATKYNGDYPYYDALRGLTQALKPSIVVEIGTWEGTSGACFAAGHPGATVITIDHHSDPGDDANQRKTVEACGEFENLLYIQGCSTEMVASLKPASRCVFGDIKEYLNGRTIDFLMVDGWHHEVMARADFDTYLPLMSKNGLVICDDIYGASGETLTNMMDFWNGLPGEKYLDPVIHSVYSMGFVKLGDA